MANIFGTLNSKGAISSGGGGHANLRTYEASIVKDLVEPNVYHLDLTQAYIIDLATGMTPTSYNAGDIVYACMPDGNGEDEIENIYVVNRVDNSTDLILQFKMPVGHSILTTTTDATYSNSEYTLAFSNLAETPNIRDYVAYINNGAITTLYQVASIDWSSEYVVLTKIGDIGGGGGSQLYQHNIVYYENQNGRTFTAQIINDNNEQINSRQKMINYLLTNDLTSFRKSLMINGKWSVNNYNYQGLYYDNGEYPHIKVWYGNGTSYTAETWELAGEEYNDTVIAL